MEIARAYPEPVEGRALAFRQAQCERLGGKTRMTKQELVQRMQAGQAWVPGKRVKIDFGGSEGVVMLDGAAGQVTEEEGTADTTIRVGWDDWQQLATGQLDGMTAFMKVKLQVEGDMSNAMQLQGVLAKLKG